jgi:hypothetical protein
LRVRQKFVSQASPHAVPGNQNLCRNSIFKSTHAEPPLPLLHEFCDANTPLCRACVPGAITSSNKSSRGTNFVVGGGPPPGPLSMSGSHVGDQSAASFESRCGCVCLCCLGGAHAHVCIKLAACGFWGVCSKEQNSRALVPGT